MIREYQAYCLWNPPSIHNTHPARKREYFTMSAKHKRRFHVKLRILLGAGSLRFLFRKDQLTFQVNIELHNEDHI